MRRRLPKMPKRTSTGPEGGHFLLRVGMLWTVILGHGIGPPPGYAQTRQTLASKEATMSSRSALDPDKLLSELSPLWLAGLSAADAEVGKKLLRDMVTDWVREAGADREPQDVLDILKRDLEARREGKAPAQRLETLHEVVAERSINQLSAETFALGKRLVDHAIDAAEGRTRGEPLLARARALAAVTQGLHNPEVEKRLHRALTEAMMDALYAVEGKAMSLRLNRYQTSRQNKP